MPRLPNVGKKASMARAGPIWAIQPSDAAPATSHQRMNLEQRPLPTVSSMARSPILARAGPWAATEAVFNPSEVPCPRRTTLSRTAVRGGGKQMTDRLPSTRRRRVLAQEPVALQVSPERRRDFDLEGRLVLGDLLRRAGAGDQGGHVRVAERELERCAGQTHAVPTADGLDTCNALHYIGRGRGVVVVGAGHRTGGQDAGIVGAADQKRDVPLGAVGQERVQRRLLEQRVAAGEQETVEVAGAGKILAGLDLVDPGADRAHDALLAQPQHGTVSAGHHLAEALYPGGLAAMGPDVDIVDQ